MFGTCGKWRLEPFGNYSTFCNKSLILTKLLKYLGSTKQSLSKWEAVSVSEVELTQGFSEVPPPLKSSVSYWNLIIMLLLFEKRNLSAKITNAKSGRFDLMYIRYA